MKNSGIYSALLLMALAAGCQREEIAAPESFRDVMEVYATVEDIADAQTKTSLEGTKVVWSKDDKIAVLVDDATVNRFNVSSESEGSTDAVFQLDETYTGESSDVELSNSIAWYPFCELTCTPEDSEYVLGNINLPDIQDYADASFTSGAFPMVAVAKDIADQRFCFKNVCGAIMLQFQGTGFIKSVSIRGNSDEVLAGASTVTAAYDVDPSITLSEGGSKTVTLDCGEDGVELKNDEPTCFIIALPPVEFDGGFTITVTDTWGGSKEYSTSKRNSVERSKIRRMPVQEYIGKQLPDYIDEYGVNRGSGIEIDGVIWAPVNCGYHETDYKYGKLYQWGRKYGQGNEGDASYPSGDHLVQGPVEIWIGQDEDNADNFYYFSGDWLVERNDNLWNLGTEESPIKTEYDPCPSGWRVPTYAELSNLTSNHSSWIKTENSKGYYFSGSKAYSESNPKLFLPAAGNLRSYDGKAFSGSGAYWSSQKSGASIEFTTTNITTINYARARGSSVRCVKDDSELIPVSYLDLDKTSLSICAGHIETITADISPLAANHKSAYWWSDNTNVATVDSKGNVTALESGKAIITAMAGMQIATCDVIVYNEGDYLDEYGENHGPGIEINGIVWAPVNCGFKAATETDNGYPYGKLYQWGRKYGQGYDGSLFINGVQDSWHSDATFPQLQDGRVSAEVGNDINNAGIFFTATEDNDYDWCEVPDENLWNSGWPASPEKTEYDPCPEGWRVPSSSELETLLSVESYWTYDASGQSGRWFSVPTSDIDNTAKVFFPAAGYRNDDGGAVHTRGYDGCYWSCIRNGKVSYFLGFYEEDVGLGAQTCAYGYSVRCVQE